MKTLDIVAAVLLVVGGLNWGLVGFFNFDLVAALFGNGAILARVSYVLVGRSPLYPAAQSYRIGRPNASAVKNRSC